jgi:L-arabinose isomerase
MRVARRKQRTAHIGIFGVGFHKYWPQFDGLLDEMKRKLDVFVDKVQRNEVQATSFGIVDEAAAAYALLPRLKAADLDLVFCDMLTYATSASFAALVRGLDVPVVLVALQPLPALDYANASTYMQLCNDDFCAVPEFTGVAIRMGKRPPPVILGTLGDDPVADGQIRQWCDIAMVLHDLRRARIGHFGHPIEHMLDMQTDQAALTAAFGCHIVQTEAEELLRLERTVTPAEIEAKKEQILDLFDTPDPKSDPITEKLTDRDLTVAARAAVALDKFVEAHDLDGLAYYYEGQEGSPTRELVTNLIVGNSLLTAAGFPMCGESDLKTCIAMMIMDRLDIGGSFAEFHPIDFREGFVLVGHDGPHHLNIAEGKPVLRSLAKYHGKPGSGASVEFKIREGPITMLSIGVTGFPNATSRVWWGSQPRTYAAGDPGPSAAGRFQFILAEGQSVRGPIPPTGNTNTRGFFQPDVRTFLQRWVAQGPTHHFALGVGHHARALQHIADILGLESVLVTP